MKNHLISVLTSLVSEQKWRWKKIERKTMALTLILLTAIAAVFGGLAVTAFAAETENKTTDTSTTSTANSVTSGASNGQSWGMEGMMMNEQGFGGRGHGFGRGPRGCGAGDMGTIEVSSEYTDAVSAILESDADVQNLIAEGYNVTSIRPIIKTVIGADGTVTTKATTAMATLQNGTSGFAVVKVDVSQAKVTEITIFTKTVIDKATS
ncbi:MAG: hypothetical protein NWE94_06175 [Candidatus Bathyarchaeota archaeon]|nr:hypothetical protein [Candidatus Bathyarchaeota archaeon]